MKTALICGISGQDGAYLAKLLIEKNYLVWGTSRDAQMSSFHNLSLLGIKEKVNLASMSLNDFRSVLQILTKVKPDEVYNLAGQTSVGLSFEQPVETLDSIATGTLNLLEAIRFTGAKIKLYNAGSGECFGDTGGNTAHERTPFHPRSPYGVAKATAFWEVANYREAYDLFACSGILYNHESPLRPERFVTQKIVATAVNIGEGSGEKLYLGDISVKRDWGWAPEYVQAMYLMLQQAIPDDYVIATGTSYPLEDFIKEVFNCLNLDWQKYVVIDQKLYRPTDIAFGGGDPSKAKKQLGWIPQYTMPDVARLMVQARLNPDLIGNS
jgi:GDPmannose 4,6-dehydratase